MARSPPAVSVPPAYFPHRMFRANLSRPVLLTGNQPISHKISLTHRAGLQFFHRNEARRAAGTSPDSPGETESHDHGSIHHRFSPRHRCNNVVIRHPHTHPICSQPPLSPGRRTSPLRSRHGGFDTRTIPQRSPAFASSSNCRGQSSLSANAQYWMGECQYRMGRHNDALASFFKLISDYPMSQKLAASTLKIGQIYTKQGDREKAQMMYERVTGQYPDSPEADVAQGRWTPRPQGRTDRHRAGLSKAAGSLASGDPVTAAIRRPQSGSARSNTVTGRHGVRMQRAQSYSWIPGGRSAPVEQRLVGGLWGIFRHRGIHLHHLLNQPAPRMHQHKCRACEREFSQRLGRRRPDGVRKSGCSKRDLGEQQIPIFHRHSQ